MGAFPFKWDMRGTINGREYVFTAPSTPPSMTLSEMHADETTILNGSAKVLYNPGGSTSEITPQPSRLDFFYALTSVAMQLELTCNNGDANERVFSVPLTPDFPFFLFSDDAYYNFVAGPSGDAFATGVLDVIDRIRCKNVGGATGTVSYAVGKI